MRFPLTPLTPMRMAPPRWLQLCLVISVVAGLALAISGPQRVEAESDADSTVAARTGYSQKIAKEYTYRFGADHPFLPSNMTTDTGEFIDPKSFPTAKYCGHCHQEAHTQWRQS